MKSGARKNRKGPGPGRPVDPELKDRRSEEILCAATKLFAKNGFQGTDLQDVADELDVGKGTIYRYFATKRVLFQAAVDRVMVEMKKSIDQAMEGTPDPLDSITLAIRRYLQFFHDHPEYVELVIQERAEFRDRKKPTYFEYREANRGRGRALFSMLTAEGKVRDIAPDRITDVMGDLIYGTMFTNYVAGRTRSLIEQADDIVDILYHGLLTDSERSRRAALRAPSKGSSRESST